MESLPARPGMPAVRRSQDPGDPVERRTEVVAVSLFRRTGVQRHPDFQAFRRSGVQAFRIDRMILPLALPVPNA